MDKTIIIRTSDGNELAMEGGQAEADTITKWLDDSDDGDFLSLSDPDLGHNYIQKRHIVRVSID